MKYKDYYKVLGVERSVSADELKKTYRRLARKYHPDVSKEPQAEARFKEIREAYEVLKDPEKRRAYDQLGANWKAGQEFRPPPGWQDFSGGFTPGFSAKGFSDFFETLFGGGFDRGQPRSASGFNTGFNTKGADQHSTILVSLEEAYQGVRKKIRLNGGRSLEVKIPAGVITGQRIRLAGQGAPGMGNGPQGDLYLEIKIKPHHRFTLEGRDIMLNVPITPWEAALGAKVQVPTLGGQVDIRVPAGSQSGRKMRLKGRGLPGQTEGDQFVVLQIITPPADSEAAQEFYARMEKLFPFNPRAAW
jgi:curved DNA-binding protein